MVLMVYMIYTFHVPVLKPHTRRLLSLPERFAILLPLLFLSFSGNACACASEDHLPLKAKIFLGFLYFVILPAILVFNNHKTVFRRVFLELYVLGLVTGLFLFRYHEDFLYAVPLGIFFVLLVLKIFFHTHKSINFPKIWN